jgi:hypothetical protein
MQRITVLPLLFLALTQPACIVAGGYSSDRGFYIWPGSLLTIVVMIAVLFLLRRRRGR